MSKHFHDRDSAGTYVKGHDEDARKYSRWTIVKLRREESAALAASGCHRVHGGPVSKDELIASILDMRWPHVDEARAVLAEPEPEPGSETMTFTFPCGAQVTVPLTPEDPRVTAPLAMTDEEILALVQEDASSDYNEGVGEFGGYVDWSVVHGILTVTVRAYTAQADDDPAGPLVRQWRLVRVDEPEKQPS
jgi:hypothetical protein